MWWEDCFGVRELNQLIRKIKMGKRQRNIAVTFWINQEESDQLDYITKQLEADSRSDAVRSWIKRKHWALEHQEEINAGQDTIGH